MFLRVECEGARWIADVGFGTVGLLEPIPLRANEPVEQFGWRYRLVEEPGLWVLQTQQAGQWHDVYAFALEPQIVPDLEVANHYVSTHPDSRFVQTLIAQRSTIAERYLLRNLDLITERPGESVTRTLRDQDELLDVLAEKFDLRFPAGTRFRIPSLV